MDSCAGDSEDVGDMDRDRLGVIAAVHALPKPRMRQHFVKLPFLAPVRIYERCPLPVFETGLRAGFPSPADDFTEKRLDLNDLVENRESTYFAYAEGDSMIEFGIDDGDLLMIDRSLEASLGDVVVAEIDGAFTVKALGRHVLLPGNPRFRPIPVPESGFVLFGVVTRVIKDLGRRRSRRVRI